MKLTAIAAAVGVVAGCWAAIGGSVLSDWLYPPLCQTSLCPLGPGWVPWVPSAVVAVGVALAVASVVAFSLTKKAFYFGALLSAVLATLVYGYMAYSSWGYGWTTVLLAIASAVLGVLAARKRPGMSEQSNPMNLPVFG
jgi:hypothetical protein